MNRKHPADDAVLDAPALAWEPDDRPLAVGGIPGSPPGYIANPVGSAPAGSVGAHHTGPPGDRDSYRAER